MLHRSFIGWKTSLLVFTLLCANVASSDEPKKPKLVPLPRTAPAPKDNPTTTAKIELGKQLFFDPRLSGDNKMSCATCHLPDKAFGDGRQLTTGRLKEAQRRNTPTVINTGFFSHLFWDGRAKSLEEQALGPITSPDEMNQELAALEKELRGVPGYVTQFQKIFGKQIDRDGIAKALAAFQRSLVSGPSNVDRYLQGNKKALSKNARRGLELFTGAAGCIRCHHGPLLSDGKFYRIRLSKDKGRYKATKKEKDLNRFRTPSLRNVAETAPYMHNGAIASLSDVVFYYLRGVPQSARLDIESVQDLSFDDIDDLVAFLEQLSGELPKITPPKLPK